MAWNSVNAAYPYSLRSTVQQTREGLLYTAPERRIHSMGWTGFVGQGAPGATTASELIFEVGLRLRRFELHNRGAAMNVGIGFRWANRYWIAGQWTDAAGTPFVDDTADAQDLPGTTADFQITTTTVNDGFVIASREKFSWVSIRIETAEVIGVGVVHVARYSDFAGTGWTLVDAASTYVDDLSPDTAYAAGELRFVWAPPTNWGRAGAGGLSGVPEGYYALNLRATDAPDTTGAVASVIEVGSMVAVDTLAANGTYGPEYSTHFDPYAEALVAFFGTADAGNRVMAEVTTG